MELNRWSGDIYKHSIFILGGKFTFQQIKT